MFFFSSRRRHTRYWRDWSSDVCSSDLSERLSVNTGLDFSDQGSFAAAVELCNGSGFCRKKTGGTMCPSYMVTLDEHDTTRARANMLRCVIDGTLLPEELTGDGMKEVMDLCVGCKACKTECPSQVDVASMKTEVLYQMGRKNGFTLRQKAAGHVRSGLALARSEEHTSELQSRQYL